MPWRRYVVPDRKSARRVAALLREAGGRAITYFGSWIVETLPSAAIDAGLPSGGVSGQIAARAYPQRGASACDTVSDRCAARDSVSEASAAPDEL